MAVHKGRGIAAIEYPTGMNQNGDPSQAWIKVKPDGRVDVFAGTSDIGNGSKTIQSQIVAETIGVPYDWITYDNSNTDSSPVCTGTFASRATFVAGKAVEKAAERVRERILDIAGNRTLKQLRRALTPRGTLVITGGENGGRWIGGNDRQLRAVLLSPFVGQKLRTFICSEKRADLIALSELIESGQVTPVIDRTYRLSAAAEEQVWSASEGLYQPEVGVRLKRQRAGQAQPFAIIQHFRAAAVTGAFI